LHPTFASDAPVKDLRQCVAYYASDIDGKQFPSAKEAGERWEKYLRKGKWVCSENSFWVGKSWLWHRGREGQKCQGS